MSFAAKTVLKPISMATNGCLISGPSLFKISCFKPYPSIPYKPVKFPNLFSLRMKESLYRISVLAANQEENNPFILEERETEEEEEGEEEQDVEEEEEEEGQDLKGNFNWGASDNDENGDGYVAPPEGTKIYVGNLAYDVDSQKLAELFEQAGVVDTAEVIYNRETDQSRGFGFVTMSTPEEAEKAVEMLNRYDVNGRPLVVNISVPRGSRPERGPRAPRSFGPSYKVYVGNLSWNVDDSRLEQVFSEYGKVVSAQVISDRETGRSRGFGFVVMSSESEMNDAIANLDGQSLDGRSVRVSVAEDRRRSSSF